MGIAIVQKTMSLTKLYLFAFTSYMQINKHVFKSEHAGFKWNCKLFLGRTVGYYFYGLSSKFTI